VLAIGQIWDAMVVKNKQNTVLHAGDGWNITFVMFYGNGEIFAIG
jgi:hypothetical protein